MESFSDPRQDLADAERAAAAPYVDYPPTPVWYPPAVGVWAGALVAVMGVDTDALRYASLAVLIGLEVLFIAWYRRQRGVTPSLRRAPREIAREMRLYAVWAVLVLLAVLGAYALNLVLAVVTATVLVTVGLTVYERRYARAAAATRTRLA
ncbi:MAG: hypothetical protein ABIQ59_13930 [Nocardioidaceae bacterium]